MAQNWVIVIGINQYEFLQPLKYAKRDAQLMQEFFCNEVGFERVFFFSDDSPDIGGKSTRPYRANLLRILRELFDKPFMGAGDNFWFFFSGHGMRYADRDYLMPSDADPGDTENTAISINYVTERLRRCGADNVVLILDACRNQGKKSGEGIGRQTAEEARSTGVISIFSCSPNQYSYEIEALQNGAFTHALIQGLGIQGQCATVERLNQYLTFRVSELVRQHKNAQQTPYTIAEPLPKSHLILLSRYATLADIATLRNDAYQALVEKDLALAEQLWIRVLAAASGQDVAAVNALQEIALLRHNDNPLPPKPTKITSDSQKGVSASRSKNQWLLRGVILLLGLAGILAYNYKPFEPIKSTSVPTKSFSPPVATPTNNPGKSPKPVPEPTPIPPPSPSARVTTPTNNSGKSPKPVPEPTPIPPPSPSARVTTPTNNPGKSPKPVPEPTPVPPPSPFEQELKELENLLKQKNFRKADEQTANLIKDKVFGEIIPKDLKPQTLRSVDDWQNLGCKNLLYINKIWLNHSDNKFGFTVQSSIWQTSKKKSEDFSKSVAQTSTKNPESFHKRVGWQVDEKWLSYDQMTFSLQGQDGHLPRQIWWGEVGDDEKKFDQVFSYIERCNRKRPR